MTITKQKNGFSVTAYQGDAKTLLAFNLPKGRAKNLAGFTIAYQLPGKPPFYLHNQLQYKAPAQHAQDATQPPVSSINAPIHKFRWLHVPGSLHQGTRPFMGPYTYTVTPRYFDDNQSLLPLDPALALALVVNVAPFSKKKLQLGFSRGFVQSQAFVHHFGLKAVIRPEGKDLIFDTAQVAGTNNAGQSYTFKDEYEWLGFTARQQIFAVLDDVLKDKTLKLDVFAYDLNEPDVIEIFLELAKQRRIRIILDNAALHHNTKTPKPEDEFEDLFIKAAKTKDTILRGKFGRYAHDKVFIVSDKNGPQRVLTGSTNLSVTGVYVNSNHVILFDDPAVAVTYSKVFAKAWEGKASRTFKETPEAGTVFTFDSAAVPETNITFSPHLDDFAAKNLDDMAARIALEGKQKNKGSLLFAVMGLSTGTGPILPALREVHANQDIFSYGISDSPGGIALYTPRRKTGVLVTGKPGRTKLPPPFNQVPGIGAGHQIHHKFVVCGFNGDNPVVYCGSSNLALGGEIANGDNLLAIHDPDVATAFALEALALVDHFDFLDRCSANAGTENTRMKTASKAQEAASAEWFLSTTDTWVAPYFDPNDLHCMDRELFG